jgi:uncharacterized membrane protein YhaH (DUF805 family)
VPPRVNPPPPPTVAPIRIRVGRGAFAGWFLSIAIGYWIFQISKDTEFIGLMIGATYIIPVVLRLRDIGTSGWWCLAGWIPLINLVLLYCLLCVPSGFAHHRQADRTMRVLSALFIGSIVLFLLVIIVK